MSRTELFVPTGTLRQRFEPDETPRINEVLMAISSIADDEYFDPSLVWTAKYLVDTEPNLDPGARLNATLATLALLVAVGEGSTRVPLAAGEASEGTDDYLDVILARFQGALEQKAAVNPPPAAPEKLIAAAQVIAEVRASKPAKTLSPDLLPTLLKRVDSEATDNTIPYYPLLLAGSTQHPALTSERMLRKEDTVARSIHARMSAGDDASDELEKAVADLIAYPTRFHASGAWHDQRLNHEQAHAALLAATSPLAFVTGGPGTGKTTIVVAILRILMRLGLVPADIALAAPTGKAAYRMRESAIAQLGSLARHLPGDALADGASAMPPADLRLRRELPEARTLHRLLEYSPGSDRFWRNKENPLSAKIVICDEASMIDLGMMHALIDALSPAAHLVLVGDADQLPPIGGGAPFRDLIAATSRPNPDWQPLIKKFSHGANPAAILSPETLLADGPMPPQRPRPADPMSRFTARLQHSYRMDADDKDGKQILELAHTILDCHTPQDPALAAFLARPIAADSLGHLGGVASLEKDTKLETFVAAWFTQFCAFNADAEPFHAEFHSEDGEFSDDAVKALDQVFDHHARARILCLTQVHQTGARAINSQMHELFEEYAEKWPEALKKPSSLMHLEPIMVTQNNYDLNLFNGDQGVIALVHEKKSSKKHPSKYAIFPRSNGGYRRVPIAQIRAHLELAYATSVHKSQGSEFNHVAVILPKEDMSLLTRQLLYTAITRASKSVTLVDPDKLFSTGAAKPLVRHTGLRERLARHGGPTE